MLISLLYISRSRAEEGEVDAIVDLCRRNNSARGVTGALVYTGPHFVQWLEGPAEAIDRLCARIAEDRRHADMTVIAREAAARRLFDAWAMAYSGPSFYADRQVRAALGAGAAGHRAAARDALHEIIIRAARGEREDAA